jgi:hypothetical protein
MHFKQFLPAAALVAAALAVPAEADPRQCVACHAAYRVH